jgi:thymidylate synthase ThyX
MAPNAQWEIRQYADAVGDIIRERFPRTWELFYASEFTKSQT